MIAAETIKTESEIAAAAIKAAGQLETETCTRCHGSGKFSRCAMYGDTCFRCRGRGRTLTKRGAAASLYLGAIRSKRAADLVPGLDAVYCEGFLGTKSGFFLVASVTPSSAVSRSMVAGVWIQAQGLLDVACTVEGRGLGGCSPETLFRVRQSPEQSVETWARAMAYQASLTRAGKPRAGAV